MVYCTVRNIENMTPMTLTKEIKQCKTGTSVNKSQNFCPDFATCVKLITKQIDFFFFIKIVGFWYRKALANLESN